jgi:hypothetical protein
MSIGEYCVSAFKILMRCASPTHRTSSLFSLISDDAVFLPPDNSSVFYYPSSVHSDAADFGEPTLPATNVLVVNSERSNSTLIQSI